MPDRSLATLTGLLLFCSALGLCACANRAAAQSSATTPESLGRLFFTRQQREELSRRRQLNVQESSLATETVVTVDGYVSRSSGKSTTWLNGVPHNDAYRAGNDASVQVRIGDEEPPVSLKAGQTLDKGRGGVTDGLRGGKIDVKAAAPSRR